jgi:ZIP family zinc transporter
MATYISYTTNPTLGIKLAFVIALHNIPEGIAIAVPIYYATNNLKKASFYTIISGISEFFGALITHLFLQNYINHLLQSITLAITAGIMISISITEFIPNSREYKIKNSYVYFFIGLIIMLLTEIFI